MERGKFASKTQVGKREINLAIKCSISWDYIYRALLRRESPSRNSQGHMAEPRPKRGFGNSFQPAIDAPRLEPHKLRHCPKRKDNSIIGFRSLLSHYSNSAFSALSMWDYNFFFHN
ncbi:hypothetical protein GBA52_027800 [Prunus armeniaca]|nr:hypothetical protein GBA52_027800 [Prunus armeniaca]